MFKPYARKVLFVSLLALIVLVLAGCASEPELGSEEMPIILSAVPSSDADEVLANAQAIADVIAERTGYTVVAEVPTSYVGSIEAMCSGEAHIGTLNTFSYIVANERECADVALVSVRFGSATYGGQVIVRADSGITSIADLAGKSFCRPDAFSTSGWIIPSIALQAEGLDPDADLSEIIDTGGHTGVVRAVYDGDCDAGATFVDARSNIAEESADVMDVVVVIAESPPIPNDTIAFAADLPEEMRDAIVTAFLDMAADEEELAILEDLYSWGGLQEVGDDFYNPFRQVLESAGVDVGTFVE